MTTVPVPRLAALLTASAKGYYATEAATQLLIGHEMWLHRADFLHDCVWVSTETGDYGCPASPCELPPGDVAHAFITWDYLPVFLEGAPCSGSEGRILRLVAELAGYDTGVALDELLSGLDATNGASVLDAIAHALHHLPDTPTVDRGPGEAVAVSDADLPLLQAAIADPGRYTPRATTDPVAGWEARAVLVALMGRETDR